MVGREQASVEQPAVPRERVASTAGDVLAAQVAKLAELFPEAVVEGRVDFDKLKATLGGAAESGPGRFSFTWAGKDDAIGLLQTPTRGTLVPCPDQSVDFDTTANAFIEGENLEVLKLLFKPYFGRVKLCYIDPPYNTGQDFVYPDDFADPLHNYLVQTGQVDDAGNLVSSRVDRAGRVHSGWLSMMYPRLFLARQLLRDDGVICVSIDDHEVHHLRMLMDEVFGAENFVECFIWKRSYGGGAKEKYAVSQHEYILTYAKDMDGLPELWLPPDEEVRRKYYKYTDSKEATRGPYRLQPLEAGKSMDRRENLIYPIPTPDGGQVLPKRQWLWSKERVLKAIETDDLVFGASGESATVSYKQYLKNAEGEERGSKPASVIDGIYTQHGTEELTAIFEGRTVLQFPKPTKLLKFLLRFGCDARAGDLILDFFAGSGTTAQAVLELNQEDGGDRRFVAVQLPERTDQPDLATIAEIAKERLRRVAKRIREQQQGTLTDAGRDGPLDLGFKVFKLAEPAIRPWSAGDESRDPDAYAERLSFYNDPLSPGAEPGDVVWEVALREGYSLATRLDRRELANGNTVWTASDPATGQRMLVCLDPTVRADLSKQLELTADTLLVVRDVALDDTAAANLALQCRLKTI